MIAPNRYDEDGGRGGKLRPEGMRDTRLLDRAIRERWPIPEEYKRPIVERMYKIIANPRTKAREASVAARVLVAMEAQNQSDQMKVIDKSVPDLHAHVVDHRVTVQELLTEPDYVDYLRYCEANSQPSLVRTNGHGGNGKPLDDGPSRNGH